MKKIIFALILLVLISAATLAFEYCPHDEIDCTFPGECSRYIDTDNDGICDYSQPAPENRSDDTTIIAAESNSSAKIPVTTAITDDQSKPTYDLLLILLVLIVLYAISYILSKKKIIRVISHRKIWNILLLISFLISGLLGILLVIRINYGAAIPLLFNVLFWHVEFSIAMFIISLFHTLWHCTYFKNLFKFK